MSTTNYNEVVAQCNARAVAEAEKAAREAFGWMPEPDTYTVDIVEVSYRAEKVGGDAANQLPVAILKCQIIAGGSPEDIGKTFDQGSQFRMSSDVSWGILLGMIRRVTGEEVPANESLAATQSLKGTRWQAAVVESESRDGSRTYRNARFQTLLTE